MSATPPRQSGPSGDAVEAAFVSMDAEMVAALSVGTMVEGRPTISRALEAAHAPGLGLDRSVCLRDVVEWMNRRGHRADASAIAEEFGGDDG